MRKTLTDYQQHVIRYIKKNPRASFKDIQEYLEHKYMGTTFNMIQRLVEFGALTYETTRTTKTVWKVIHRKEEVNK